MLARLARVTDPRFPQWRIYPLDKILAVLILASICGESSLRGMWLWAVARWQRLKKMLDLPQKAPALSTLWYILRRVNPKELAEALKEEISDEEVSVDGKTLRGSKRRGSRALEVVTACGQKVKEVIHQVDVESGDEIEAAMRLLMEIDPTDKVVTLDAKLTQREIVNYIVEEGGDYIGVLKGNHPALKDAVEEWIRDQREEAGKEKPDYVEHDKGHGRIGRERYGWWMRKERWRGMWRRYSAGRR